MERYNVIMSEASDNEFFSEIKSKERNEVSKWMRKQKFKTKGEKTFKKVLKRALKKVNYDFWISNIEPSVDEETGKLIFAEGKSVMVGHSYNQLKEMCEAYDPKRGSRMAKLYELFIWYLKYSFAILIRTTPEKTVHVLLCLRQAET